MHENYKKICVYSLSIAMICTSICYLIKILNTKSGYIKGPLLSKKSKYKDINKKNVNIDKDTSNDNLLNGLKSYLKDDIDE